MDCLKALDLYISGLPTTTGRVSKALFVVVLITETVPSWSFASYTVVSSGVTATP
jgi:hypothetical protein